MTELQRDQIKTWAKATEFEVVFKPDAVMFFLRGTSGEPTHNFKDPRHALRWITETAIKRHRVKHAQALADNMNPGGWDAYLAQIAPVPLRSVAS